MEELGMLLFFASILAAAVGIILLIVSVFIPKLLRASMYILLFSGLSFMVSLALCSKSTI